MTSTSGCVTECQELLSSLHSVCLCSAKRSAANLVAHHLAEVVHSGAVVGAREALFGGVPFMSISLNWLQLLRFPFLRLRMHMLKHLPHRAGLLVQLKKYIVLAFVETIVVD
ncbi:hypothetical protein POM88_026063 [Heracleum sosnowskyi]|uniref:Uncharacterized protein n=1 Tax=Heracleum sosnowskyi TaxID=360622 RepID=A0AAD8I6E5_9APIA|nr:hypothetical protein POM88_026063 [Heracleum sosnowskyi]